MAHVFVSARSDSASSGGGERSLWGGEAVSEAAAWISHAS